MARRSGNPRAPGTPGDPPAGARRRKSEPHPPAEPRKPARASERAPGAAGGATARAAARGGGDELVLLLRAVNVAGKRSVPMADLRAVADALGLVDARTYIQSGNLVATTSLDVAAAEESLARALQDRFGFEVPVVARSARRWRELAASSPFPEVERDRPHLLLLGLSQRPPPAGAVEQLTRYCTAGERVAMLPDGLWVDYPSGAGTTKLTPAVLDRAFGSVVTTRNWRTVQALRDMLRSPA